MSREGRLSVQKDAKGRILSAAVRRRSLENVLAKIERALGQKRNKKGSEEPEGSPDRGSADLSLSLSSKQVFELKLGRFDIPSIKHSDYSHT